MKKALSILLVLVMLCGLLPTVAVAAEAKTGNLPQANDNLLRMWYTKPADITLKTDRNSWQYETLAIGNGYMGGLVFGGISKDRLHFNEKTMWARTGHAEENFQLLQSSVGGGNTGFLTNLLCSHGSGAEYKQAPIFQIDGNFGLTAGVNEMLLQSQLGYADFLPTIPQQWANGSVQGLVARGNFVVDMAWSSGTADVISITSRNGGEFIGRYENLTSYAVKDSEGNTVEIRKLADDKIAFDTVEGETYTISFTETSDKLLSQIDAAKEFSATMTDTRLATAKAVLDEEIRSAQTVADSGNADQYYQASQSLIEVQSRAENAVLLLAKVEETAQFYADNERKGAAWAEAEPVLAAIDAEIQTAESLLDSREANKTDFAVEISKLDARMRSLTELLATIRMTFTIEDGKLVMTPSDEMFEIRYTMDGNKSTRWRMNSDAVYPVDLILTYEEPITFDRAYVLGFNYAGSIYAKSIDVSYWDDATGTWVIVAEEPDFKSCNFEASFAFEEATTTKVRLRVLESVYASFIAEFQISYSKSGEPADFTVLNQTLADAEKVLNGVYQNVDAAAQAEFDKWLDIARAVAANENSDQYTVDAAEAALRNAINALAVTVDLKGETMITVDDEELTYTVVVSNTSGLATATIDMTIDGNVTDPELKALNGWYIIAQTYSNGKLSVVMGNNAGVTGQEGVEILSITVKTTGQRGKVTASIDSAVLSSFVGEAGEAFVDAILGNASVETEITYSVYDVNQDGSVDQLDITRAQRFYGLSEGDEGWNALADVNGDKQVDISDLILILNNYSK